MSSSVTDFDRATVTWIDRSSNEAGYRVLRSLDGGVFVSVGDVPADTASFVDTGIPEGASATYDVTALTSDAGTFLDGDRASASAVVTPQRIRIELEDFINGGQGVAYNDDETANRGGFNYRPGEGVDIRQGDGSTPYPRVFIPFIRQGEWMRYDVNVQADWTYAVNARIDLYGSNFVGSRIDVDVDGSPAIDDFVIPGHLSNLETQATVKLGEVALTAGTRRIELRFDGHTTTPSSSARFGDWDYLELVPIAATRTDITSGAAVSVSSNTADGGATDAIDNLYYTAWESIDTEDEWIAFDFGTARDVDTIELLWGTRQGITFRLQTSTDGSVWSDLQ
ncbi:MAG: discoidin domain-containing protein, partial [Planctomycetota bacterium]